MLTRQEIKTNRSKGIFTENWDYLSNDIDLLYNKIRIISGKIQDHSRKIFDEQGYPYPIAADSIFVSDEMHYVISEGKFSDDLFKPFENEIYYENEMYYYSGKLGNYNYYIDPFSPANKIWIVHNSNLSVSGVVIVDNAIECKCGDF